jgi:hypothetical protein
LLLLKIGLTIDAQTNARYGVAPRLGNGFFTHGTMGKALALRQSAPCQLDSVIHTGIDLILHRPVTRPPTRHYVLLLNIAPLVVLTADRPL